ncbi:MAG: hypothetical protein ACPGTS_02355 [Minisyncoccia bacterium]
MTKFTHKKGKHRSKPRQFKIWWKPKTLKVEFTFHESCRYDHGNDDQFDWNKLTGITFSIDPLQETVMLAWRYNVEKGMIELAAYYHVKGDRRFSDVLATVRIGETASATISVDYKRKQYTVETTVDFESNLSYRSFSHNRKLARRIQPWFGGNKPAPQTMTFDLKFS